MLPSSSAPLASLSPSRFERITCPARVAFEQLGSGTSKSSPAAVLGEALHRAIARLLDGRGAADAWEAACDDLAATGPDPRTLPSARRAKLRFERRATQVHEVVAEVGAKDVVIEQELESADKKLKGCPDLVLLREADLVVVDHKSGSAAEGGEPLESYVRQVQLYVGLATEHHGLPASRGVLLSMRDGDIDVPIDPGAVAAVGNAAREALDRYNEAAPGPQQARPAALTCRWCPYKARCDAFWTVVDVGWSENVGGCLRGVATSDVEVAANGLAAVAIESSSGTAVDASVTVAGVPATVLAGVTEGSLVAFTGLSVRPDDGSARWRDRSAAYVG